VRQQSGTKPTCSAGSGVPDAAYDDVEGCPDSTPLEKALLRLGRLPMATASSLHALSCVNQSCRPSSLRHKHEWKSADSHAT
jgi:hypothetical protein